MPALLLGAFLATAAPVREVPLRVEPPQRVIAIVVESNGNRVPVTVVDGRAQVPGDLALPWKVAQLRFEPSTYTQADLDAHRPLILRELGRLTGAVREGGRPINHEFIVALRANGSSEVEERKFSGTFETPLPAGIYQAVVTSDSCATRLRSGIVIKPGAPTDLGMITCEPAFAVSFRVIDAKSAAPVHGAKVVWDPPDAMNAEDARVMYARRWSGTTDRRGAVVFKVGPLPIPLRWRVEAAGYALERTARAELFQPKDAAIGDVKLRPSVTLRVRVHLPDDAHEFDGAALLLAEPDDERSLQYVVKARQPLREGEVRFRIDTFGPRRVWIEDAAGAKLCYRDIRVEPESSVLDFAPQRIEIRGRVTRGGSGIEKATVIVARPDRQQPYFDRVSTDAAGGYSVRTWQSGEVILYATKYSEKGPATMGAVTKRLHTTADQREYVLDFESPAGGVGVTVTDAETHQPLKAGVLAMFRLDKGNRLAGMQGQTDDAGKVTFDGFPEGIASLDVTAPGYRSEQFDVPFGGDAVAEHEVKLTRSAPVTGRVVSISGAPIPGAVITADYDPETEMMPRVQTLTDAAGKFHFDSPRPPGTTFYVVAAGWSLSIVTLDTASENVVTLTPPSSNTMYLLDKNEAPPNKPYRMNAVPLGGEPIPSGALYALAEANGMNEFQLLANGRDGAVVLAQFLAPGTYDFLLTRHVRPGPNGLTYERLGRVTLPGERVGVLHIGGY